TKTDSVGCGNRLFGELHGVAPFHYVLDLLSLVDLVDQFRRVIDEAHGGFSRHSRAAQPVDVGDAQAMEAQVGLLDLDEKLLPPARRLEGEVEGVVLASLPEVLQQRTERRRHRNRERSIFAPLWR